MTRTSFPPHFPRRPVSTTGAATGCSTQGLGRGRIGLVVALLLSVNSVQALPETKRVNSVKSLTNILSLVEKDNGDKARFVTVKLQIYLEDVYISQGTTIVLRPVDLSAAIGELLSKGKNRSVTARAILKRYKDGEFHEK